MLLNKPIFLLKSHQLFLAHVLINYNKKTKMHKSITLILSLIVFTISAQNTSLDVISNTPEFSYLVLNNGGIDFRLTENKVGWFTEIEVDGFSKSYDIGNPDLPVYTKLIEIPFDGDISLSLISKTETLINLSDLGYTNKLMPSQPSVSKSEDAGNQHFNYNETVYNRDAFYSNELITIERLGVMREHVLARIQVSPFAYNPISNTLKVMDNIGSLSSKFLKIN